MILIESPTGVSRLHGSRRLFATLKTRGCDVPVIHHLIAPNCPKSELALQLGMQVGGANEGSPQPWPQPHAHPRSHLNASPTTPIHSSLTLGL